jgi:hypothetical protein
MAKINSKNNTGNHLIDISLHILYVKIPPPMLPEEYGLADEAAR